MVTGNGPQLQSAVRVREPRLLERPNVAFEHKVVKLRSGVGFHGQTAIGAAIKGMRHETAVVRFIDIPSLLRRFGNFNRLCMGAVNWVSEGTYSQYGD